MRAIHRAYSAGLRALLALTIVGALASCRAEKGTSGDRASPIARDLKKADAARREVEAFFADLGRSNTAITTQTGVAVGSAQGEDTPSGTAARRCTPRTRRLNRWLPICRSRLRKYGYESPISGLSRPTNSMSLRKPWLHDTRATGITSPSRSCFRREAWPMLSRPKRCSGLARTSSTR